MVCCMPHECKYKATQNITCSKDVIEAQVPKLLHLYSLFNLYGDKTLNFCCCDCHTHTVLLSSIVLACGEDGTQNIPRMQANKK